MSAPVLKVNTFISRQYVDSISKFFIIFQLIYGINRISIIGNIKNNFMYKISLAYSLVFTCVVTVAATCVCINRKEFIFITAVLKYTFCSLLIYTLRGRLLKFYKEIYQFDTDVGFDTKISRNSIQNIIQMSLTFTLSVLFLFIYPSKNFHDYTSLLIYSPLPITHGIEIYYLGHLIALIPTRLRMITYHMKLAYANNTDDNSNAIYDEEFLKFKKEVKRKPSIEMGVLMDLYYRIIKAYDYLNDAVKWQLLILLTVSFTVSIAIAYESATLIISKNFQISVLFANISFAFMELLPLYTICLFADQVRGEVDKLREMLSCCLYENNLDKTSRIAARAFMGLTEARDLSFSLFNMFNIDISLPFNFMGLLLTYLIILLQFQKVITPNTG